MINQGKKLLLENFPFSSGEKAEVAILFQESNQQHYPLRRTFVKYIDPTKSVAQKDSRIGKLNNDFT